ncbi:MAG: hypothetical protein HYV16_14225 [Gammaproteobacteria bacterium]|nr:hypothetical protein [Gammaproteobacteria bacterium]
MNLFLHRCELNPESLPMRLALQGMDAPDLRPRDAVLLFDARRSERGSLALGIVLSGTGSRCVLQRLNLPLAVLRECIEIPEEWPGDWLRVDAAALEVFGGAAGVVDYWLSRALWLGEAETDGAVREATGSYRLKVRDEIALLERRLAEAPQREENLAERQSLVDAFRVAVKSSYRFSCAFCGAQRVSPTGQFEVEAVSILPREQNGRLDLRNGLALCRLHAWGFNQGLLSLDANGKILAHAELPREPAYKPLWELEGASCAEPRLEQGRAAELYLNAHREMHGFS